MQKEWLRIETADLYGAVNQIPNIESMSELYTKPAGYDEFLVWHPEKKIYGVYGYKRITDFCDEIQEQKPEKTYDITWLLSFLALLVVGCILGLLWL